MAPLSKVLIVRGNVEVAEVRRAFEDRAVTVASVSWKELSTQAGFIADAFDITRHANDEQGGLAHHIAALLDPPEDIRRAG